MPVRREIDRKKLSKILESEQRKAWLLIREATPSRQKQWYSLEKATLARTGHGDLSGERIHPSNRLYLNTKLITNNTGAGDIFIDTDKVRARNALTGEYENYYDKVYYNRETDYDNPNKNRRYWDRAAQIGASNILRSMRPYEIRWNRGDQKDIQSSLKSKSELAAYKLEAMNEFEANSEVLEKTEEMEHGEGMIRDPISILNYFPELYTEIEEEDIITYMSEEQQ